MSRKIPAPNNNKEWLQWVLTNSTRYGTYHNHKETMAWVITGFYTTGIITFGSYMASHAIWPNVLLTLMVILTAACIILFSTMQFKMRWVAADTQQVLLKLGAQLSNNEITPESNPQYLGSGLFKGWPKFIADKIKTLTLKRNIKDALRIAFTNPLKLDDRWKTEISSYVLIIIATLTSITLIWRAINLGFIIVQIIDWVIFIGILGSFIWFNINAKK